MADEFEYDPRRFKGFFVVLSSYNLPHCGSRLYLNLEYRGNKPKSDKMAKRLSVKKWELLVELRLKYPDREISNGGSDTCGFCMIHLKPEENSPCHGCPVKRKTRVSSCGNTPYFSASTQLLFPESGVDDIVKQLEFIKSVEV